mmetsp:Transcript_75744/g.167255  ORF Transcript_75744/g.167255 Transcript_75744/m.167255 type:complete len:81 (+) Transcript_75744:1911-2153(+)
MKIAERGASSKPANIRSAEKPCVSRHCTKAPAHLLQRDSCDDVDLQQGLSLGQQQRLPQGTAPLASQPKEGENSAGSASH